MAVSKATADGSTGGVAPGYVEDAFEARTLLADFFSILLAFCPFERFPEFLIHRRQPGVLHPIGENNGQCS